MNSTLQIQATYPMWQDVVNKARGYGTTFIHLDSLSVCADNEASVNRLVKDGKAVLLPYIEEIAPENNILSRFIEEEDLTIPRGTSARKYIFGNDGLKYSYYSYKERYAENALKNWCKTKGFEITLTE